MCNHAGITVPKRKKKINMITFNYMNVFFPNILL